MDERVIAPIFTGRRQAVAAVSVLAFFLLLPLLPKPRFLDRRVLYPSIAGIAPVRAHTYWTYRLLAETTPIDVLFIGPSTVAHSIDTPLLQDRLSRALGRPARVVTEAHSIYSLDYDYVSLMDVLRVRPVRMLVWERKRDSGPTQPQAMTNYLWDFRLHRPAVRRLDRHTQVDIYFYSVMNGLRLVLAPILTCRGMTDSPHYDLARGLGSYLPPNETRRPVPPAPAIPLPRLIHHRRADPLVREGAPLTTFDRVFFEETLRLAQAQGVRVVLLQSPYDPSNQPRDQVTVPAMQDGQPGADLPIVAALPKDLFGGLSDDETLRRFFGDPMHFNAQGGTYHTNAVFPALLQLYRSGAASEGDR